MLLTIGTFYILIILGNIETVFSQECVQRDEVEAGRDCKRECQPDGTCRKPNRECVCDGLCGLSCLKKKCPLLTAPLNGDMAINPNERTIGAEVSYSCNNGYVISGHANRVCQENKTWNGTEPICIDSAAEETCDENDLPANDWQIEFTYPDGASHAVRLAQLKPPGTIARFNCEHFGYGIVGSNAKICRGGEWHVPEPSCEKIRCPLFELTGGTLEYHDENNRIVEQPRHGDIRTATCSDDYTLNGMSETLCSAGVWQDELPICEQNYSECGVSGNTVSRGRVVGGNDANPGAWPWQVLLDIREGSNRYKCGGVLIDRYWVLTTAHCVSNEERTITAMLGMTDLSRPPHQQIEVEEAIPHPWYESRTLQNDIGLLKLRESAQLNANVRLVCLPDNLTRADRLIPPNPSRRHTATLTGWGYNKTRQLVDYTPVHSVARLQQLALPLKSREDCLQSLGGKAEFDYFDESMFCAGYLGAPLGACKGDAGGPLVKKAVRLRQRRWILIGLTSWGRGCAAENELDFFTNVPYFMDWITETMISTQEERGEGK